MAGTMTAATPAYDELVALNARLHHLGHLGSIASWDRAANMPPKGNEARARAMAELARLLHRMRTAPTLRDRIDAAEQEDLDAVQRANLREIDRRYRLATALPDSLVHRRQLANLRCEHAWRTQRPANDWAGFLENFLPGAGDRAGGSRAAGRSHGPAEVRRADGAFRARDDLGHRRARLRRGAAVAARVARQVRARQAAEHVVAPHGPFPVPAQRALCEQVMRLLGFDFEAGRLDVSTHPFCGGVPEDVRMTTRFRDDEFVASLTGTIHETGHGRYEQNLPRHLLGQPIAAARSMALHESQSLSLRDAARCASGLRRATWRRWCGRRSATSRPSRRPTCTGC